MLTPGAVLKLLRVVLWAPVGVFVSFLPAIIASRRRHPKPALLPVHGCGNRFSDDADP